MNTKIKASLSTVGTRLTAGAKQDFGALKAKMGRAQPHAPIHAIMHQPSVPTLQPQTELLAELRSRLREHPWTDPNRETPIMPARLVVEEQVESPAQPEGKSSKPHRSNIFYRLANAFVAGVTSRSALRARGKADAATFHAENTKLRVRQIAELDAALPAGISVTPDGRIHGEIAGKSHGRTVNGKQTMVENQAYCAAVINRNLNLLATYKTQGGTDAQTLTNAEDKLFTFTAADGESYIIHLPAKKDMGRLENVTFIRDGEPILTREDLIEATKDNQPGEETVETRANIVIARLAGLCDKDQQGQLTDAGKRQLVALSSIYVQGTIGRGLLCCQSKQTGASVALMAASHANSVMQDGVRMARCFDENGKSQLKPLSSALAANVTITREGDALIFKSDLKTDIKMIEMQDLPHMQGHTIELECFSIR
jgi:hypothetical protein